MNIRLYRALYGNAPPAPVRGSWSIRLVLIGFAIGVAVTYVSAS